MLFFLSFLPGIGKLWIPRFVNFIDSYPLRISFSCSFIILLISPLCFISSFHFGFNVCLFQFLKVEPYFIHFQKPFLFSVYLFCPFFCVLASLIFQKDIIYLFLERGKGGRKRERRNISVWLPLACPLLGTWPTTQACALTGNWTDDPFVHRLVVSSPLSHTSQGWFFLRCL